jgi:hypothetical protein
MFAEEMDHLSLNESVNKNDSMRSSASISSIVHQVKRGFYFFISLKFHKKLFNFALQATMKF